MLLMTGPLYSGKHQVLKDLLAEQGKTLETVQVFDKTADLAETCESSAKLHLLADYIATEYDVVILTETGGGVVPSDKHERAKREKVGRLGVLLADRADTVYRVFCGIPTKLK